MISKDTIEEITRLRHLLHRNAELSMQEKKTVEILKDFLWDHTNGGILDQGNWFACLFGEGQPGSPAAFRADMDALPIDEGTDLPWHSLHRGVSHKCGHDGHMAALCGLAMELSLHPPGRPVWLIFQPGEETGEGGRICARFVREQGIREVYAFHNMPGYPEGDIVLREGLTQPASEGLHLSFQGLCSHASEPEKGNNPAEAIARILLKVQEYGKGACTQEESGPDAGAPDGAAANGAFKGLVLCTVVGARVGNGDFGIAAGDGELFLTLRAEYEEELEKAEKRILDFAREQADKDQLELTWERRDYFPETRNTAQALDRIRRAAAALGKPVTDMKQLWRASEDFGYYTKVAEGAIFYIGAGENVPALHTPAYDFNDKILGTAVEMFSRIV